MRKLPNPPAKELIEQGKSFLNTFQLEEALDLIKQSLTQSQLQEGSDLSFQGQILWCRILFTKARFSGDQSFALLALNKLAEITHLTATSLPVMELLAEIHLYLAQLSEVKEQANQLLQFSKTHDYLPGMIRAFHFHCQCALKDKNYVVALQQAREAQKILIEHTTIKDACLLASNYLLLSQVLFEQAQYDQAKNYSEKLLSLSDSNDLKEKSIQALLVLGQCAIYQKEYPQAISYLLQAKSKSGQINQKVLWAESVLQIGILYAEVSDYKKAINCFISIKEAPTVLLKNTARNLTYLNAWGKACFYAQQYEQAGQLFEQVLQQGNSRIDQKENILALAYLGRISAIQKVYNKALRFAKRTNLLHQQIEQEVDGIQVNLLTLGIVHYQLGKYSEAIKLTSRGITASKRLKDEMSEIRGYQVMSQIFQKQKDYKNALLYQSIYTKFYEDFFQRNDRQVISDLAHEFEVQQILAKD